ncbi:TetR/AcrR family transcriptional regulator [Nocardia harenae]|uniref:TetR/AcrR family transcriptional regulator n=1 Tax=Nocardia harenae TaxID=358707 RepID=UPI00083453B2|nr:TetR family transcriptional regulator [Nocardia harenae]
MFNDRADLSTAARIRDAAVLEFGQHGFGVGVRAIAARAEVSPGLVNHHFGSKEGLRRACDDHVLGFVRDQRVEVLTGGDMAGGMLAAMAEMEEYAPLFAYLVRSLEDGGPLADSLFDHIVDDAVTYTEEAVAAGIIKPSRDPAARARYLMLLNLGATLLYLRMRRRRDPELDDRQALRDLMSEFALPALEMYTQGLLTDPAVLDSFLQEK